MTTEFADNNLRASRPLNSIPVIEPGIMFLASRPRRLCPPLTRRVKHVRNRSPFAFASMFVPESKRQGCFNGIAPILCSIQQRVYSQRPACLLLLPVPQKKYRTEQCWSKGISSASLQALLPLCPSSINSYQSTISLSDENTDGNNTHCC